MRRLILHANHASDIVYKLLCNQLTRLIAEIQHDDILVVARMNTNTGVPSDPGHLVAKTYQSGMPSPREQVLDESLFSDYVNTLLQEHAIEEVIVYVEANLGFPSTHDISSPAKKIIEMIRNDYLVFFTETNAFKDSVIEKAKEINLEAHESALTKHIVPHLRKVLSDKLFVHQQKQLTLNADSLMNNISIKVLKSDVIKGQELQEGLEAILAKYQYEGHEPLGSKGHDISTVSSTTQGTERVLFQGETRSSRSQSPNKNLLARLFPCLKRSRKVVQDPSINASISILSEETISVRFFKRMTISAHYLTTKRRHAASIQPLSK